MTRNEFIKRLSEKTGYNPDDIRIVLNSIPQLVVEILKEGQEVKWRDFGTFSPAKRAARKFSVPMKNGGILGTVEKEERLTIKFTASGYLKGLLNE